ncbi:hypothetical protein X801_03008, partial [Opisthorchis viverrini]
VRSIFLRPLSQLFGNCVPESWLWKPCVASEIEKHLYKAVDMNPSRKLTKIAQTGQGSNVCGDDGSKSNVYGKRKQQCVQAKRALERGKRGMPLHQSQLYSEYGYPAVYAATKS